MRVLPCNACGRSLQTYPLHTHLWEGASSPEQRRARACAQTPLGMCPHQHTRAHGCARPDTATQAHSSLLPTGTSCAPPAGARGYPASTRPFGKEGGRTRPCTPSSPRCKRQRSLPGAHRSRRVHTVCVGASPAGGDTLQVAGQSQVGWGQADGGHAGPQLGRRGELQQGDVVVEVVGVPVGVCDGLPRARTSRPSPPRATAPWHGAVTPSAPHPPDSPSPQSSPARPPSWSCGHIPRGQQRGSRGCKRRGGWSGSPVAASTWPKGSAAPGLAVVPRGQLGREPWAARSLWCWVLGLPRDARRILRLCPSLGRCSPARGWGWRVPEGIAPHLNSQWAAVTTQ